jgi:hypothetical protein
MIKSIDDIMFIVDGNNPFRTGFIYGTGGLGYKPYLGISGGGLDSEGNIVIYNKRELKNMPLSRLSDILRDDMEILEGETIGEINEDVKEELEKEKNYIIKMPKKTLKKIDVLKKKISDLGDIRNKDEIENYNKDMEKFKKEIEELKKNKENKSIVAKPEPEVNEIIENTNEKLETIVPEDIKEEIKSQNNFISFPTQTGKVSFKQGDLDKNPINYAFKEESDIDLGIKGEKLFMFIYGNLFNKFNISGTTIVDNSPLQNSKEPTTGVFTEYYKNLSDYEKEKFVVDFGKKKMLIEMKAVEKDLSGINDTATLTSTKLNKNYSFDIIFENYNGELRIKNILNRNEKCLVDNPDGYKYFVLYSYKNKMILVDILKNATLQSDGSIKLKEDFGLDKFKRLQYPLKQYKNSLIEFDGRNLAEEFLLKINTYKEYYNSGKISLKNIEELFGRDSKIKDFIIDSEQKINKYILNKKDFTEYKTEKEIKKGAEMVKLSTITNEGDEPFPNEFDELVLQFNTFNGLKNNINNNNFIKSSTAFKNMKGKEAEKISKVRNILRGGLNITIGRYNETLEQLNKRYPNSQKIKEYKKI